MPLYTRDRAEREDGTAPAVAAVEPRKPLQAAQKRAGG
jgi:hypothetical protein